MSSRTRLLLLLVALVGLGVSVEASYVHYRVLTDPTYISPCDINATFNCSGVYLSRFGTVGGISVALGGVIWFGLATLVAAFAKPGDKDNAAGDYLFAMSIVGLGVVLYLGYVSFIVLHKGCVLCLGTYACVLAIFGLSSTASKAITKLPGRLSRDLGALVSRPATLVATVLYLATMLLLILLFPREGTIAERAANAPAPSADVEARFAEAWAQQNRVDLGIPFDGAKVIVVKFNDYECPTCNLAETWYQPVIKKFEASNPGAVKYIMKDWAWNISCNPGAGSTFKGHEASCAAAAAARIAKDRGKFDEMKTWLFANQGTTPENVAKAAGTILGVTDFAKESALKLADMKKDFADGMVLHISGTPTYFINGVRLPEASMVEPRYFEMAINIEIKKATPAP